MTGDKSKIIRLAATVLLLRDGSDGLEVFMEKRHIKSDFVGGAYVFPGGRVDPEDTSAAPVCRGRRDAEASAAMGLESGGLAFWIAAVRECFEEAGVLLAYDGGDDLVSFAEAETEDRYKRLRDDLNGGETSILEIARNEGLELATDAMEVWSHWLTPMGQPRRYDTWFFVAQAPEQQTATHDDWELTSSAWVTPREAIDKAMKREWMIIFPTLKNLDQLSHFETAAEALQWARDQGTPPTNLPKVLLDDEPRIVLPGDEGYERADEDVTKADPKIFAKAFVPSKPLRT
ncbi:MAG: NUDIX domain-containing protein [Acidobacteriota bacterium]